MVSPMKTRLFDVVSFLLLSLNSEKRTIIFALKFTSGWKPGNRLFPWAFILPVITPSFVFRFATRKTRRRTPFRKIEMPNLTPCEFCFHPSFLSSAAFFPFFYPCLRLFLNSVATVNRVPTRAVNF